MPASVLGKLWVQRGFRVVESTSVATSVSLLTSMPSIASLSRTTVVPTRTLADHRSSPASRAIEFLIGGGARRGALSGRSSGRGPSPGPKGSLLSILPPGCSYLYHQRDNRTSPSVSAR